MRDSSGGFASGQNATYSSQPARSTTANNTDTSGATVLPSAADSSSRLTESETRGDYRQPAQAPTGAEARGQYYSAEGMQRPMGGESGDATYDTSRGGPQESYGGSAPTSMQPNVGFNESHAKPKGTGLQEGGFSSEDAPNASFQSIEKGDVGGGSDPGRVAVGHFQAGQAKSAVDSGYPGSRVGKNGSSDQGGYEQLGSDEAA